MPPIVQLASRLGRVTAMSGAVRLGVRLAQSTTSLEGGHVPREPLSQQELIIKIAISVFLILAGGVFAGCVVLFVSAQ